MHMKTEKGFMLVGGLSFMFGLGLSMGNVAGSRWTIRKHRN